MKTDLATPNSYVPTKLGSARGLKEVSKKGAAAGTEKLLPKDSPDYKLDLASKKTPTSAPSTPGSSLPSASMPDMPTPDLPKPDITSPVTDVAKKVAKEEVKEKIKEEIKTEVVKKPERKIGSVKKPAVIFIKGLDLFSSPSKSERGYAGVGRLADSVEGSSTYGWNQKAEILEEIMSTHADYPVILVGHSLGGDTAVDVANELDSLDSKFRGIDLLVTMDAIGFNNDIIPQNVKSHLNVFGEKDMFLNDGPHVARRNEKTNVTNILSPEDHTDIDDNKEVQYEISELINKTLGNFSNKKGPA